MGEQQEKETDKETSHTHTHTETMRAQTTRAHTQAHSLTHSWPREALKNDVSAHTNEAYKAKQKLTLSRTQPRK